MGIRGLTTFIASRSHLYFEKFELSNSYLVIDGNGLTCQLYSQSKCNDCYGGDYDKYANTIYKFFNLLKKCNVTPIIVFDGGYEERKLKTIFDRFKARIRNAEALDPISESRLTVFPLFMWTLFLSIIKELGLKHVRCDFEADTEIACIAKDLNCPVLALDSDFYIFDIMYIPISSLEMRLRYKKTNKTLNPYVPCQIYRINKFLESSKLNCEVLPLLAVLLGNDYIRKSNFLAFFQHMKVQKTANTNEQQRLIKSVIEWLQNETFESAVRKILSRFKKKARRKLSYKLQEAIKGYHLVNSSILKYIDLDVVGPACPTTIDIVEIEKNMDVDSPTNSEEENSDASETDSDCCSDEEEDDNKNKNWTSMETTKTEKLPQIDENQESNDEKVTESEADISFSQIKEAIEETDANDSTSAKVPAPQNPIRRPFQSKRKRVIFNYDRLTSIPQFQDKLRHSQYPSTFIDLICQNTYYAVVQKEDYAQEHSHNISLEVVSCIHKILTQLEDFKLTCVARFERSVKRFSLPVFEKKVPTVEDIAKMDIEQRKKTMLYLLDIEDTYLDQIYQYPASWHMFLVSLKYWLSNSETAVHNSKVCALILGAVLLNFADFETGYCRSTKSFYSAHNEKLKSENEANEKREILESFTQVSYKDLEYCLKTLTNYFEIDLKMRHNRKAYEPAIVHTFAEFQSCLLHINYLNCLFDYPFEDINISKFFDGTFCYHMTVNFRRRNSGKQYCQTLLGACPTILKALNLVMDNIVENCVVSEEKVGPRKRKKNKKPKEEGEIEPEQDMLVEQSDEGSFVDENNKFSMLMSV